MAYDLGVMIFLNGLTYGFWLFLLGSGLTLIFGVLRILNFAHGAFFMLGAYLAWQCVAWFDSFWIALLIAPLIVAATGALVEYGLLRHIYNVHVTFQLLLTFGLLLLINDIVKLIWGVGFYSISEPEVLKGAVELLELSYPKYNFFVITVGAITGIILWVFLIRTTIGKIIRAASMDREIASTLGVNVPFIFTIVFAAGTWLGAFAGVLASPLQSLTLGLSIETIVEAFVVVVVGGLGSIPGALIGALLIGQFRSFGILFIPRFEMVFVFVLMAVILIIRPEGLFGERRERR